MKIAQAAWYGELGQRGSVNILERSTDTADGLVTGFAELTIAVDMFARSRETENPSQGTFFNP
jgi:hypothetical protein